MGARMTTSIALTRGASEPLDVGQAPKRGTNRRKEPVPLDPRKAKARESIESSDDEQTPEQRIERMAQRLYEQTAAIDAAAAMAFQARGKPALKGPELARKRKISLSDELWEEMLIRVAEGESLFKVCEDEHMPHRTLVYKHLHVNAEKARAYDTTMLLQADKRAEQIIELSELGRTRAAVGASPEEINAIKTMINSLQWVASRANPKKWGDKQSIDLDAKVALTEPQIDMRLAALIAKAKAKT